MESNGGGVCVPPSELCESNVNASTEHCNSDVAQESPEDIPPPQQEGWADAFLCAQCIRAKNRSTSDGCCDSLQCAFLRGFDLIDDIVVLDIPWSWESLFKCELSYSKVAAELKPLFDEAENAVTGLLWQMSTMIRWGAAVTCSTPIIAAACLFYEERACLLYEECASICLRLFIDRVARMVCSSGAMACCHLLALSHLLH